jgi:hypothetical protein
MQFRNFLLNEDHAYLGQRVGDILNALHDLTENGQHMGTRLLMLQAEGIVQQIRRILHTHWEKSEMKYLPILQKVGVAIMKSIDGKNREKTDLLEILQGAQSEIEKMSSDLGTPLNNLASPATTPAQDETGVNPSKTEGNPKKQQIQKPQTPSQQPQVPDSGQGPIPQPGISPEQPSNQVQGI